MKKRIFTFEHNGKTVLGFDTGLGAQPFAQAKIPQFITRPGHIIYPDGKVEKWQSEGVLERQPQGEDEGENEQSMVIWGPLFPGERLDEILNDPGRKDEALDLLYYWLRARIILENYVIDEDVPFSGPAGALVSVNRIQGNYPAGTVFFPPGRVIKRSVEAEYETAAFDNSRWLHPDLKGDDELSFNAGVMLYRIFCGAFPFTGNNQDELAENIREGVYIPLNLAAPGLDPVMCEIITKALSTVALNKTQRIRPAPQAMYEIIGGAEARHVSSWVKPVDSEERERIKTELDKYGKKKSRLVKTRRFIIRNTGTLIISILAVISAILIVRGAIKRQEGMPNTRGMTPIEVAQKYYGSFAELDHMYMDACVVGRTGRSDIEMVISLYVTARSVQAYEYIRYIIPAQEWVDAGSQPTDRTVFGVTDLKTGYLSINEEAGTANLDVEYILWTPGSYGNDVIEAMAFDPESYTEENAFFMPDAFFIKDRLSFTLRKDAWRISGIDRTVQQLNTR